MSLEELVHNCKQGNRGAQEQLYRRYASVLYGICLKYSRNKAEAEDSLHDSFMTIYNKIGQYGAKGSFEGWIKRITVNTVLQKYRKQEHLKVVSENVADEIEVAVDQENIDLQTLLGYIQQLPNKYRLTFNMYVLDGYSHQEIAQQLGTSEGTSKSNLSRARVLLKEKIEADYSRSALGVLFILIGESASERKRMKKKIKKLTKPLENG
ncbi:sigma-70 family RNA polymerase sigma factor [Aggregatimonas sangjinii]|uniref:Sigma-70 family RNA polymerase sigma factor n=1 Tax=Aggregatimonas sangjinii TaxID=2583587 RepID=A0A5B7SSQ1_9FLAO|nr:sigma-70 family RNA polymerase sigma factor [Aggregatimonas sangjinii]QCX01805.1 sigma-70 family RNA polymerase sigma factor [Aggregatimonas sangjinii]